MDDHARYNAYVKYYPKGNHDRMIMMHSGKLIDILSPLLGKDHKRVEQFIKEEVSEYIKNKSKWRLVLPKTLLHLLGARGCGGKTAVTYHCAKNDVNLLVVSDKIISHYETLLPMIFARAKSLDHCVIYFDACNYMLHSEEFKRFWETFWIQYNSFRFRENHIWIITKATVSIERLAYDYHNELMIRGVIGLVSIPTIDMVSFFLLSLKKYTEMLYTEPHPIELERDWHQLSKDLTFALEKATYGETDEFVHRIMRECMCRQKNLNVSCSFVRMFINTISFKELKNYDGTIRRVQTIAMIANFEMQDDLYAQYWNKSVNGTECYFDVDNPNKAPLPEAANTSIQFHDTAHNSRLNRYTVEYPIATGSDNCISNRMNGHYEHSISPAPIASTPIQIRPQTSQSIIEPSIKSSIILQSPPIEPRPVSSPPVLSKPPLPALVVNGATNKSSNNSLNKTSTIISEKPTNTSMKASPTSTPQIKPQHIIPSHIVPSQAISTQAVPAKIVTSKTTPLKISSSTIKLATKPEILASLASNKSISEPSIHPVSKTTLPPLPKQLTPPPKQKKAKRVKKFIPDSPTYNPTSPSYEFNGKKQRII